MDKYKIFVIIVNWQKPNITIELIENLKKQTYKNIPILIDNGSQDDSIELISNYSFVGLKIFSDFNGGFGYGCNLGIKKAIAENADYIWFLNNDALPEDDCLQLLVEKSILHKNTGLVGSKLIDNSNLLPPHYGHYLNPYTLQTKCITCEDELIEKYKWLTMASSLLPVNILKEVGFFDEKYFMYWEDADYCMRLKNAGYKLHLAENAKTHHITGTSSSQIKDKAVEWYLVSSLLWIKKHFNFPLYGKLLILVRYLVKSVLLLDVRRFKMTMSNLLK